MKKSFVFSIMFFSTFLFVQSQNVAINTTGLVADPSSMLDITSTTKGLLVPRIALSATNVAAPVVTPLNSLFIYNTATAGAGSTAVTPGYYYWNSTLSLWIRLLNTGDAWLTTGNYLSANGVFGTMTNFSVVLGTNGFARGGFMNSGELFLNPALTFFGGDVLSAYASGGQSALNGYSSGAGASISVYGENTETGAGNSAWFINSSTNANSGNVDVTTTGASWGIFSDIQSTTNTHAAVGGVTRSMTSTGVAGAVNAASTITILVGGSGGAFISPGAGVAAWGTGATANGGLFAGNGATAGSPANGSGSSSVGTGVGVFGSATTPASGTGGIFAGNNSGYSTLAGGSGVAATGVTTGVFGTANSAAAGTGGVFGGNNLATTSLAGGSGVAGTGAAVGVFGYIPNNAVNSAGGLFMRNGGGFSVGVCMNNGGTDFKIIGTGAVSTIVKNNDDKDVIMFAPESPEMLFQDFGRGALSNGVAIIDMDPSFAKNIIVDQSHPLNVFVQLEGDCKGVYITNKTATGFEVRELQGGTSNVQFSWFVTGNRIDRKDDNGVVISQNQDLRFPILQSMPTIVENESIDGHVILHETKEVKKEERKGSKKEMKLN